MKKRFVKIFIYNMLLVSLAVLTPLVVIFYNYYFTLSDTYTQQIDTAHQNTFDNSVQTIDMLYQQTLYTISNSIANDTVLKYLSYDYSKEDFFNAWKEY